MKDIDILKKKTKDLLFTEEKCWNAGEHTKLCKSESTNDELEKVEGRISFEEAKLWFAKYCIGNPGFLIKLLTGGVSAGEGVQSGIDIHPFQDAIIRTWLQRDFNLFIGGRGLSKTTITGFFIIAYALLNPGVKIGVTSAGFRQSKAILSAIEEMYKNYAGLYLRKCMTTELKKEPDSWWMTIGKSQIRAIPLGKVRGYRFNVLICDEMLLLDINIVNTVLKPFLTVQQSGREKNRLRKAEKILIEKGELDPKDSLMSYYPNNKIIQLSSASYKFEALYKDIYCPYVEMIMDKNAERVNHSVFRLSYQIAPEGMMDHEAIEDMRKTFSKSQFKRELEAIFTDDSGGYYDEAYLQQATLTSGEEPGLLLEGRPGKKYILAIDPCYDGSPTSDDFAMCVLEIDEENKKGILVHAYALASSPINKRALYLRYLLSRFNIVYMIIDNAGGDKFIKDCKELKFISDKYDFFEHDYFNDNYEKGLAETRKSYNLASKKIIHSQPFGQDKWIMQANLNMQSMIQQKALLFASILVDGDREAVLMEADVPVGSLHFSDYQENIQQVTSADSDENDQEIGEYERKGKMHELIDTVGEKILLTKKECSLIEVRSGPTGTQTFDLPPSLKNKNKDVNRVRRDSYTVLLLASWGLSKYFDLMSTEEPRKNRSIFKGGWIGKR